MKINPRWVQVIWLMMAVMSTVTYANNVPTYDDSKLTIHVTSSEPLFQIKLKSNPTTGYGWQLKRYDNQLITPVKHSFQTSNTRLIGASGFEVWTFQLKPASFTAPIQTTLKFVYSRPWEASKHDREVLFKVHTAGKQR